MSEILYGRQPTRECLRARRRHAHQLDLAEGIKKTEIINDILNLAVQVKIPVQYVPRVQLDRITDGHQGVILHVGNYVYATEDQILGQAGRLQEAFFGLALDHMQDPHNLGAILRTAEAVGVHGVIIPDRRAVGVTPAVVSASAGASEHIRVVQVTNLTRTLETLKDQGIWAVGLDNGPDTIPYNQVDLDRPLVLVVGAEGIGLSRLVKKTCDMLIQIPMRGKTASLNASVASGIALYAALSARGF